MRPGSVAAYLQQTADPQPSPTELPQSGAGSRAGGPYAGTRLPNGEPQDCQGGPGYNSWYGNGQVNASKA